MSELEDVREELVQRLEQGDALSGKEILATTAGGALVAAGLIVVLAGASAPRSLGTIAVGLALLALAALALAPWLRRQRTLWRDVAVLRRRERALRPWLVGAAVLVPVAWFVPEWLGSGDLLRSSDRARVPNPGQPAEADVPFLASLWDAVRLPLIPLLVIAAVAARSWIFAAGAAWVVLVALMAQVGYSGEARYALPGAALVAIAGAVAIAGLPRPFVIAGAILVAVAAVPRMIDLADLRADQRHKWALARDLARAVEFVGRDAVLRCGTPYVGPYRGPLLAYRLDVAKEDVEPDATPRPPGVVFRSRRLRDSPVTPAAEGFRPLDAVGAWDVDASCR